MLLYRWITRSFPSNVRLFYAFVWIAMIVLGYVFLEDNPAQHIYLSDIMRLFGALTIILWVTKMIVSQKVVEKIAEAKVEIIEA